MNRVEKRDPRVNEVLCDLVEILEDIKSLGAFAPLYIEVLKRTRDHEQALLAAEYARKIGGQ